jgi:signal transduction histidine kinase
MLVADLLLFTLVLLSALLIITVLSLSKRSDSSLSFVLMVFSGGVLWSLSIVMFRISTTPEVALFWDRLIYIAGILSPIAVLLFSYIFPEGKFSKIPTVYKIMSILPIIIFVPILIFTKLWIQGINISPQGKEVVLGPFYIFWAVFILLYFFWAFLNFFFKYKKFYQFNKTQKRQFQYLFIGLDFPLIGCLPFNVIGPLFGNYEFIWAGPLTIFIFFGFTTLSIFKYRLFEIKVLLTESLVGTIGLILSMLPFVMPTTFLKVVTSFVFFLFCIFGYLLIRSTYREIERRKDMERLTKKLKEASRNVEKLSEMKSEFLKVVNHQLRTPVSIIKGMTSMLADGSVKGKKKNDFIKKLYVSSERLTTILDDILVAQGLIGGGEFTNFSPCRIEEIVKDQINYSEPLAKNKKLKIIFKKSKKPLPVTLIDKAMMSRAIARLIDNAILYTEKGEIEISMAFKKIKTKKFIQISIKDSGIGLNQEDKKSLFKLFRRGKAAVSVHPNGSGLGLFIVANFVRIHKGVIRAESKGRNKGTTFIVTLPVITEI